MAGDSDIQPGAHSPITQVGSLVESVCSVVGVCPTRWW